MRESLENAGEVSSERGRAAGVEALRHRGEADTGSAAFASS